jgi:hypothetical protein
MSFKENGGCVWARSELAGYCEADDATANDLYPSL